MNRMLILVLLGLTGLFPSLARATAQESDLILVDGESYALNTNPLTPKLLAMGWKPPANLVRSSSNWRGYVAEWKIEQSQLVLVNVTVETMEGDDHSLRYSIREDLFPATPRVVAEWYSGALIIPDGEMVEYVHMGYGTSYDHYQVLRVSAGQVVEHLQMTGEEFEAYRQKKFEAFSRTQEFKDALEKLKKQYSGVSEEQHIQFLMEFESERYLSM